MGNQWRRQKQLNFVLVCMEQIIVVPTVNKRLSSQYSVFEESVLRRSETSPGAVIAGKGLKDRCKQAIHTGSELSTGVGSENTPRSSMILGQGSNSSNRTSTAVRQAEDIRLDEEARREWIREKAVQETSGRRPGKLKDPNLPVPLLIEPSKESQLLDQLYSLYNQGKTSEWLRGFRILQEKIEYIDKNGSDNQTQRIKLKQLQSHPVYTILSKEYNKGSSKINSQIPPINSIGRTSNQRSHVEYSKRRLIGMSSERSRNSEDVTIPVPVNQFENTSSILDEQLQKYDSGHSVRIGSNEAPSHAKMELNLQELYILQANLIVQEMSDSTSSKPKRAFGLYRPTERGSFLGKRHVSSQPANVLT